MLEHDTSIFLSYHPDDREAIVFACAKIKAAGWRNVVDASGAVGTKAISERIEKSGMFIVFISKSFAQDDHLMLEEFAYASVILRKPFLPVWLNNKTALKKLKSRARKKKSKLYNVLNMLTAKHPGTPIEGLISVLTAFLPDQSPYTPSEPKICQAPCEAYEGDNPYIFISYAHDNAPQIYPIVESLFTAGWDVWYDEGIKPTERYLPVIADHIKRSAVFVLMLTKRCLERPFIMNYELAFARKLGIPVIPVLLENIEPPDYAKHFNEAPIQKNELLNHVAIYGIHNRGISPAIPPAIKRNRIYDVIPPSKLKNFETGAYEGGISITKYCGKSKNVTIPSTIEMFDGKVILKITHIGYGAFMRCYSLTSIILPEGIISIGQDVFRLCKSLTRITLPKSLKKIGDTAFKDCISLTRVILPESVTDIGCAIFKGCTSLKRIIIPNSVTNIGQNAFDKCTSLTCITFPENITDISSNILEGCTSLKRIIIPDNVTHIGDFAFSGCKSLSRVTFPKTLKFIGNSAFSGCKSLSRVTFPKTLKLICDGAFSGCESLSRITLPESMTTIECDTFRGCKSLTKVSFSKNITYISGGAFENCTSLARITLPVNLIGIGNWAFTRCELLSHVVIPKNIKYIAGTAFYLCRIDIAGKGLPQDMKSHFNSTIEPELQQEDIVSPEVPCCDEQPYALVCCAKEDLPVIHQMLVTLYWEGFNIRYDEKPTKQIINECACVLAFFTKHIEHSAETLDALRHIVERDTSRIIQLFPSDRIELPDVIKHNLQSLQGISHVCCSEQELVAWGRIRESLRAFYCYMIGPRGFEVVNRGDSAEIIKFIPTGFTHVIIPKTFFNPPVPVTSIGDNAFSNCTLIPQDMEELIEEMLEEAMGDNAFYNRSVTSVTIPKGVTNIGENAFKGCTSLARINIPEGVTTIGHNAFYGCRSLTSISIPASVTTIGDGAFECYSCIDDIFWEAIDMSKGPELVIYCPRDSVAWQYAEKHRIKHEALPEDGK